MQCVCVYTYIGGSKGGPHSRCKKTFSHVITMEKTHIWDGWMDYFGRKIYVYIHTYVYTYTCRAYRLRASSTPAAY
jgi:hypothetical protein